MSEKTTEWVCECVTTEEACLLTGLQHDAVAELIAKHGQVGWPRVLARLAVLHAWKTFAEKEKIAKTESAWLFPRLYKSRNVDLPDWVYKLVKGCSYQTLFRWEKLLNTESSKLAGVQGTGKRVGLIESTSYLREFFDAFDEHSAAEAYRKAILKFGNAAPSEATIRRYLKRARSGC